MDKIIKILQEPQKNEYGRGIGLGKILYQGKDNTTYEAHVTLEEFKVRLLKQKLFDLKLPIKIIEEFEEAVRDSQRKDDME